MFAEQVLLSMPMQRVCREDCRGCPQCGQKSSLVDCGCEAKPWTIAGPLSRNSSEGKLSKEKGGHGAESEGHIPGAHLHPPCP